MQVKVKRLSDTAKIPTYGTPGAACFDLYADLRRDFDYATDGNDANTMIVPTGLSVEVPEGFAMMIYSRSGHGFKQNIRLANCVGVIDSDYRGEIMVKLARDQQMPIKVADGERIAQAMVVPVDRIAFEEVSSLSGTERGEGGFGSTGK